MLLTKWRLTFIVNVPRSDCIEDLVSHMRRSRWSPYIEFFYLLHTVLLSEGGWFESVSHGIRISSSLYHDINSGTRMLETESERVSEGENG